MYVEMFCHVLMFYLFRNVLLVLLFLPVFSLDDNLVHNVTRPFFIYQMSPFILMRSCIFLCLKCVFVFSYLQYK